MINIKFINATSVQLVDKNNNVVTTIGEFSGSPIVYTYNGNTFSKNDLEYYHFAITGTNVQLSGVIDEVTTKQQFTNLFKGCTNITDASQLELTASDLTESCYAGMFLNCSNLKTPPVLAATGLALWCYNSMFAGCSSLSSAPTLPATTLTPYCYYAMFYGCSNLSTSPYLPAATLTSWCYNSMFYNCTSLNSISAAFSAWTQNGTKNWVTNVAESGSFNIKNVTFNKDLTNFIYSNNNIPIGWIDYRHTPLTFKAVNGPANVGLLLKGSPTNTVTLKYKKNNGEWLDYTNGTLLDFEQNETISFSGANNYINYNSNVSYNYLTDFYRFGSTSGQVSVYGTIYSITKNNDYMLSYSYIYYGLFNGFRSHLVDCTNLIFPLGTYNWCYSWMFEGCSKITNPPKKLGGYYELVQQVAQGCFADMFYNCTSLTSAPQLPATGLAYQCYAGMFAGCENLSTAPALPATTLANSCYESMFNGCSNLTAAPALPATTLAAHCYQTMFVACSNLKQIDVNFTSWGTTATSNWVGNVAPTGVFIKPNDLPEEYGYSKIPNTDWTVVNKYSD